MARLVIWVLSGFVVARLEEVATAGLAAVLWSLFCVEHVQRSFAFG